MAKLLSGGKGIGWAIFCLMETQGISVLCDMEPTFCFSAHLPFASACRRGYVYDKGMDEPKM